MYNLNYCDILNLTLDYNTPRAVTYSIAISHGLKVNKSLFNSEKYVKEIVDAINVTQPILIPEDEGQLMKQDLVNIARFVNHEEEWNVDSLLDSIEFIRHGNRDPLSIIEGRLGTQDNDNIESSNIVILYKCCIDLGLQLHYFSNIDEFIYLLNMHVMYSSALSYLTTLNSNLSLIDDSIVTIQDKIEEIPLNLDRPNDHVPSKFNDNYIDDTSSNEDEYEDEEDNEGIDEIDEEDNEDIDESIGSVIDDEVESIGSVIDDGDVIESTSINGIDDIKENYNVVEDEQQDVTSNTEEISTINRDIEEISNTEEISINVDRELDVTQDTTSIIEEMLSINREDNREQDVTSTSEEVIIEMVEDDMYPELSIVTYSTLSSMYEGLNDIFSLQMNIKPSTNTGAVSLAAILYHLDISTSSCPIEEYKLLQANSILYIPIDKTMREFRDLINLKKNFNPLFPPSYYSPYALKMILDDLGYDGHVIWEIDELYSEVHDRSLNGRWYNCLIPSCNSETYITLEDVSTIDRTQLISYGFHCTSNNHVYTVSEMIETISHHRRVVFPHNLEPLNEDQLRSLFTVCNDRIELIDLINIVRSETEEQERHVRSQLNSMKKEDVTLSLMRLLEVGMSMRGWRRGDTYPLASEQTMTEDEDQLMANISSSILSFYTNEDHNEDVKITQDVSNVESSQDTSIDRTTLQNVNIIDNYTQDVSVMIRNLPLVKYRKNLFYFNSDKHDGLTIEDRLNIVMNDRDNEASCIRLSSNFIIYTAYYYLSILSVHLEFNIDQLSIIS